MANKNDEKQPFNWKQFLQNSLITMLVLAVVGTGYLLARQLRIDQTVEFIELKTYNLRVNFPLENIFPALKNRHIPSEDIVKVEFDDLTFRAFSKDYGTWPWPRYVHADMIHFLNKHGAKAIVYDLMPRFKQLNMKESDQAMENAYLDYDNVYFSFFAEQDRELMEEVGEHTFEPEYFYKLSPLGLPLIVEAEPDTFAHPHPNTNFYREYSFDYYAPLFEGLYEDRMSRLYDDPTRLAVTNHATDMDGVSRGNALIVQMEWDGEVLSDAFPIKQDKSSGKWYDSKNRRVNKEGYLLNEAGELVIEKQFTYYPYIAFKVFLDLKYPDGPPAMRLTPDGHLKFGTYDIPLTDRGHMLVNWYNYHFVREKGKEKLQQLKAIRQKLQHDPSVEPAKKQKYLLQINEKIEMHETGQKKIAHALPDPYYTISAAKILRAMKREKEGKLEERDRFIINYIKDKVLFIGSASVATHDKKATPQNPATHGMIIPITMFDNLMQGNGFIHRAEPHTNLLLTLVLCLLTAFCTFKMRSPANGIISALSLILLYIMGAVVVFKLQNLWVNVAWPFFAAAVTLTAVFVIKYIGRDKDYQLTYAMATTDSMTGLYNHRYFQEHMLNSIERADRYDHKFSLLLMDIDFFKKFNDTYGHQAGDEVLRCVARKLKSCVRSVDVVARYGGEEMAVVLDRANEEEALEVARKLVKEVAAEPYPIAEGVAKHVTISIGVSTYPTHGRTPTEMIEFSDAGLYRAKECGRNQVGAQYDEDMPEIDKSVDQTGGTHGGEYVDPSERISVIKGEEAASAQPVEAAGEPTEDVDDKADNDSASA